MEAQPVTTSHYSPLTSHRDLLGALAAGLIVVAFCFLLLWHDPLVFWNDDYELSILPVFADVARSWSEWHWPLLSPYSWVCNNLAGEFQYGTFSIFVNAAVVLIWKFPLTFPQQAAALSITHLFVLAAGAFLLARSRDFPTPLSIFVALIAALNGWIICWGATDWFGALGAFAWFPWCWWAMEKSLSMVGTALRAVRIGSIGSTDASEKRPYQIRAFMIATLWPAPFVYLLVTGGFPYTVLMLAVLVAWLTVKSLVQTKRFISILPTLLGVVLGFGMSAPAWLALLNYVHGSARASQAALAHWQWIVPWRALPGFVLPCWTVNWADFSTRYLPHTATELACGFVAPVALIAGFATRGRTFVRHIKWELILLFFVLSLSMLPMFGVFRWSFRWLPFVHLVLALCAAEVLHMWHRLPADDSKIAGRMPVSRVALILVILFAIVVSISDLGGPYAFPLTWIFLLLAGIWVATDAFLPNELMRSWLPAVITFVALLATYLCIPSNCGVPKYNFSQELTKPEQLDRNRLYLAVYSPAEYAYRHTYRSGPVGQVARPGSTPMWSQLHFINGYSPILSAGIAREFKFFIHGEIDGDVGKYLVQNQAGVGGILEQLGVDGIVIAREVAVEPPAADWQLAFSSDDGRVFHRRSEPFERVRSVEWIDSIPEREFASAEITEIDDSRNYVAANVDVPAGDEPALLTFSRPYLKGYRATLNNQSLEVESYRGLFPTIEVPAGSHGRLILRYRPMWLVFGGGLSMLCVAIFAIGVVAAAVSWRQTPNRRNLVNPALIERRYRRFCRQRPCP
jgi:hypothetical protein